MNILIMKLLSGCLLVIIAILWMKRPLFWAISGGLAAASFCTESMYPTPFHHGKSPGQQGHGYGGLKLLLYHLSAAHAGTQEPPKAGRTVLKLLFNNRRVNASAAPAVIGLLPSAGAMTICAEIVRSSCQDYLSNEDMTCVTSFYRHIPESFLPTYSSILIALAVSGVGAGEFVLAMLSLVAALFIIGHIFYLRRVPRSTGQKPEGGRKRRQSCCLRVCGPSC